jgi:hypothetical protein
MQPIRIIEAKLPGPALDMNEMQAAGWRYVDIPAWVSQATWDMFQEMWGDGNFAVLAMSKMASRGIHAQVMLAPSAFDGMKVWLATQKKN